MVPLPKYHPPCLHFFPSFLQCIVCPLLLFAMLCPCGRRFRSEAALLQHQAAKPEHHGPDAATQSNNATPERKPPIRKAVRRSTRSYRDTRMWMGVKRQEPVHIIDAVVLQPSVALVSSAAPCELVCSYNWQKPKGFQVPGEHPFRLSLTTVHTRPNQTMNRICAYLAGSYPPSNDSQRSEKNLGG
jgi:hypothetical protein